MTKKCGNIFEHPLFKPLRTVSNSTDNIVQFQLQYLRLFKQVICNQ